MSGELFAKFYLGLGTPPLYASHPKVEYLLQPDQKLRRFGNHIIINEYGMRSPTFERHKQANELRVMVFGDSVINGGSLTDHKDLATSRLQTSLSSVVADKEVVVGNISAGSWGPGNLLAYAQTYGFFDADVIVLVISSHDYADTPTFKPLDENVHPTKRPVSALWEGISRYLIRYVAKSFTPDIAAREISNTDRNGSFAATYTNKKATEPLEDLKQFLQLAKNHSNYLLVVQHWEKGEIVRDVPRKGNLLISEVVSQLGVETVSLKTTFEAAVRYGKDPYRDYIHPNLVGQELIGQVLSNKISAELNLVGQ